MKAYLDEWLAHCHNVAMLEEGIAQRLASMPRMSGETTDQWIRRILGELTALLNSLKSSVKQIVRRMLRQVIPVVNEVTIRIGMFSDDDNLSEFTEKARVKLADDINKPSVWRNLVRTAVQKANNDANDEIMDANKDLILGYQWIATLDSRTCPRCAVYDGMIWYIAPQRGQKSARSRPSIPLHPNCRCTYVPVLRAAKDIEKRLKLTPGSLNSDILTGQPNERLSYDEWLASVPEDVQKSALGERFDLFKKGVPMDRFVSGGRILDPEDIDVSTKIKKVPHAKVKRDIRKKVETGDVSPEVPTLAKKASARATVKKSRSRKVKESVRRLAVGKLREREIRRRVVIDGEKHEEIYDVFEYFDAPISKMQEWVDQFEDLPIPDITTRGLDLRWPSRHLSVTETGEGFTEEIQRYPGPGSVGVQVHPRAASDLLTDNDKQALVAESPQCVYHGALIPVERRGTFVRFRCPCGQKWKSV